MIGDDPQLTMVALVIVILILVFAIVWFVFMLPMERGLHKRRMELIQRKLRDNEERLARLRRESRDSDDGDARA